ncbi:MAG: peptide deformylase [Candidatus Omnitrophota bacterium]
MNELELKIYPESCLRIKTNPVERFESNLPEILRTMADIMYVNNGIGLAATQVGIGASFLVADAGEGLVSMMNPEVVDKSKEISRMEEGCLSLPGVAVDVPRPKRVTIKAQNEKGESFVRRFDGMMGRVIQHEIDHLHGRLIIDYMNPFRRAVASRKLSRNKRKVLKNK